MVRVRVMYWKEIPVQVQAEDASGRVSRQLEDRFQQAADMVAMHSVTTQMAKEQRPRLPTRWLFD